MTEQEIQTAINAFPALMSAKGLRKPDVQYTLEANKEPHFYAKWEDKRGAYGYKCEFIRGGTAKELIAKAEKWLAALPTADEARRDEFLGALGGVVDLGKELGIELDYLNPLREAMKRLSDNILTDKRTVAARSADMAEA